MAYEFDGFTQYLISTFKPTAKPMTFAAHFYHRPHTDNGAIMAMAKTTPNEDTLLLQARPGDTPENICALEIGVPAAFARAEVLTDNTWLHAAARFESNTLSSVVALGSVEVTNTNGRITPPLTGLNNTTIGALVRVSTIAYLKGMVADAAAWSAALTTAEIASLAKGFSPRRIRPQSLVFYAPLLRNLQDLRSGVALTAVNAPTVANHPRVY